MFIEILSLIILYNNPINYYLIDFNASDKINNKNNNIKIATFPYMPQEKK